MKVCPRCQKTYGDENLNFCLEDGATLMRSPQADDSVPATVLLNQTRPTDPYPSLGNQTAGQENWNQPNNQNQFSMQPPPKKSKGWLWAVAILGGLVVLCGGGGLVGLVMLGKKVEQGNRTVVNANYSASPSKSSTPWTKTTKQEIDLSKWAKGDTDIGDTEFRNGEFLMQSDKKNFYYVLAAQAMYKTENATTKVTVKNLDRESTALGFGLVFHSNTTPLVQDYAFLIDSENKKYRVVRHVPGDEVVVAGWTRSAAIKDGTQENVLEVRDENKRITLFINGELIKTMNNDDGYSGGVAGLYAGDAVRVAFSNLEISK